MFHHHPDGYIIFADFHYPLEEFQIDEPGYTLPPGFIGREYLPGQRHALYTANSAEPQPLSWPEGDGYIAQVEQYKAAYAARQQAEAPPPPQRPDNPLFALTEAQVDSWDATVSATEFRQLVVKAFVLLRDLTVGPPAKG